MPQMYSYLDSFVVIEEVIFKGAPVFISYRGHKLENKNRNVFLRSFFLCFLEDRVYNKVSLSERMAIVYSQDFPSDLPM